MQASKKKQVSEEYRRTAEQSDFFGKLVTELERNRTEFPEIAPEKETLQQQEQQQQQRIEKTLFESIMVEKNARGEYEKAVKRAKDRPGKGRTKRRKRKKGK